MENKADTDVRREMQIAALKYDLSKATKQDDIVKFYLQSGVDPKWLSVRYGVDLERCQRYVAALTKQKEAREDYARRYEPRDMERSGALREGGAAESEGGGVEVACGEGR